MDDSHGHTSEEIKSSGGSKILSISVVLALAVIALIGVKMIAPKPDQLTKEMAEATTSPSTTPTITSIPTPAVTPITLAEISKHSTKDNCWFAIDGKVYDVTKYAASGMHKGGDTIYEGCGKDATTLFNTRPMGSGTPHSDKARSYLPNFQIGILN